MGTRKILLYVLLALNFVFPLTFTTGAAAAQQYAYTAPRIHGFDVDQVRQLSAGTELNFTLHGTPGGIAIISIPGAADRLLLEEREPGLYAGGYTIKTRDKIAANSNVTVNLRLGNQVASMILDEPLIAPPAAPQQRRSDAVQPKIDRFDVVPNQLVTGSELVFTLNGTPGGRTSIRIGGVAGRIFLEETRNGVYEGVYTIKQQDKIVPESQVTANLRVGGNRASTVLGKSLLASQGNRQGGRRAAAMCANCGAVEAINLIDVKGEGSYLGMIAGGLAGALLGRQVGGGSGRDVATVAGAAGGAYAGNAIEKGMKASKHYEVIVRLESGGTQAVSYQADPGLRVGEKVRVENGTLVRDTR